MKFNAEDKIIFIYVLFGALWIYFSDEIISSLFNEEEVLMRLQTYKGLIYVVVTGVIFYLLLKNYFKKLRDIQSELEQKNKELNKYTSQLESGNEALKESYQDLYEQTEDLKVMVDFINNISRETFNDPNKFLSKLLRTSFRLVPVSDYGSVYKIKNGKVKFVDAIGHNLEKLKKLAIDQEVFSTYEAEPQIVDELLMKNRNKLPQEEFQLLVEASKDIKQSLTFYLVVEGEMIAGISLDIDRDSGAEFTENGEKTLRAFSNIAESFYTFQRYNKLQGDFQRDIILSMIKFLEIHDKYTGGHSEEVAEFSQQIAEALDLNKSKVKDAYWTGLVHDIGKLIVPSVILNKKSNFRKEDYEYIKNHPRWAYKSLSESERLKDIAECVLYHHERWDGNGYPEGLEGKEIPLISRIVAVADVYSAMTADRSYRDALSEEEALQELKDNKGKQFDPEIVDVFIKIIENDISETIKVN